MKQITVLQKSIDQIGETAVLRFLPKGYKLYPCDLHGAYTRHYTDSNPTCSLCITHNPAAEGTTATQVEHYIDIRDMVAPAHNPHS